MEFTTTVEVEDSLSLLFPYVKIGVLGGTFDPIHNGHVDMALQVMEEFHLKNVMLLPAGDPPHKEDGITTAHKRLHMAALAVYDHPRLEINAMEIKREGQSYTVDTMRELAQKYQEHDFYFIIGSDSLFLLDSWKDIPELCRLTRFICVRRPHHDRVMIAAEIERLAKEYGAVVELSEYTGKDISSSQIRERVAEGRSITGLVPLAVEEYIYASGLYK